MLDVICIFLNTKISNIGKYPYYIFFIPWSRVPHLLPAQKRECDIFGPGTVKNSKRTTGEKLASQQLV